MVSEGGLKQSSWLVTFAIIEMVAIALGIFALPAATRANSVASPGAFIPPKTGSPTDTRSGASRNNGAACFSNQPQGSLSFTPLVPPSSQGFTQLSHPSFFVYIPPTTAQELLFSLKDDQQQVQYQTAIKISGHEGILRIRLPKTASPLEIGKRYQWVATLLCSKHLGPDSPFVMGWVERSPLATTLNHGPLKSHFASNLARQSAQQAIDSQVNNYYLQGIWYDVIENLADLKQQQPRDSHLASTWQKLLESNGLGAIAVAPLLAEP